MTCQLLTRFRRKKNEPSKAFAGSDPAKISTQRTCESDSHYRTKIFNPTCGLTVTERTPSSFCRVHPAGRSALSVNLLMSAVIAIPEVPVDMSGTVPPPALANFLDDAASSLMTVSSPIANDWLISTGADAHPSGKVRAPSCRRTAA